MCYHASFSFNHFQLAERYRLAAEEIPNGSTLPVPYANGFSFPLLPVLILEPVLKVKWMQWGLIPRWTKSPAEAEKIRVMTLNAKLETLREKPAFRHTVPSQRCLIPCSGFYEWREIQKKKYPYRIESATPIFSMAGIYDEWLDTDTGTLVNSFAVVTAPANHLMEQIHNTKKRMPLVLAPEEESHWLSASFDESFTQNQILHLQDLHLTARPIAKDFQQKSLTMGPEAFDKEVPYPELAFYPLD